MISPEGTTRTSARTRTTAAFKVFKEAHDILIDDERRAFYDRTGFKCEEDMMASRGPATPFGMRPQAGPFGMPSPFGMGGMPGGHPHMFPGAGGLDPWSWMRGSDMGSRYTPSHYSKLGWRDNGHRSEQTNAGSGMNPQRHEVWTPRQQEQSGNPRRQPPVIGPTMGRGPMHGGMGGMDHGFGGFGGGFGGVQSWRMF